MIDVLKQYFAKHRATQDVVRIHSGATTTDEQARIGDWRSDSSQYQQQFTAANNALADLRGLESDPDILALVGEQPKQVAGVEPRRWPKFAVAATVMIAAWLGYQNWPLPEAQPDISRYVTRIGEQKLVTLPDGSEITLNTGTLMLVEMTESRRRVILERGEAFFDVNKDPLRPFIVELEQQAVTVLGTQFNIQVTPKEFTLALVKGTVALHKSREPAIAGAPLLKASIDNVISASAARQHRIQAGTVVRYSHGATELTAFTDPEINKLQGWRSGVLRFDSVPLKTLIQELNRYSAKKILIEDTDIMDLKVYATVRIDRLDLALNDLQYTLPVEVVQHFDRVVIRKSDIK